MPNFLCISVRYLDAYPTFHGRNEGGEPEWPPSPMRIFQAILAAAATGSRKTEFQENACPALAWLQVQDAPIIHAPAHHVGMPVRIAVPNNDLDVVGSAWSKRREPKKQANELKTMKTVRPTRMFSVNDDPATVYYLWHLAEENSLHLESLARAACFVTHLGWGVDMVAVHVAEISQADADKLPGERWEPVENSSGTSLRVPIAGTLDALISKHQSFLNRLESGGFKPVPPLSAFRVVGYRCTSDTPIHYFTAFRLLHPEEERMAWVPGERANVVAAMVRHAAAGAARNKPREWVDAYVHGHRSGADDVRARFSYLPLPTIESRGEGKLVVGGIRRVLVAELECSHPSPRPSPSPQPSPGGRGSDPSHLRWARQMLPGQFLVDEKTGARRAMLAPLAESDWVLRQYTREATTWATTTPIVLPGSDDGKYAKTIKLFMKALAHAGYSPDALAEEPEFQNVSFWPGGELALKYWRPDYLRSGCWSVYHARVRWKRPVAGPLALGAGRHCGLGVFAAVGE